MPLKRIICPHCEQPVEFNMTSVTRSRECPLCGQNILLQFTTQEKRQRRKALLMPSVDTGEGGGEASESDLPPGLAVSPMPIQGDLRERMMMDPEVRQRVKIVKISLGVIGTILVVVVLGSVFHWWSAVADLSNQVVKQYNASRLTNADDTGVETPPPPAPVANKGDKVDKNTGTASPFKVDPPPTATDMDTIMKVATSFLEAENVDKRLDYILSRKVVEKKMREYYQHHADGPIPYETVENMGTNNVTSNALDFAVILKDGERRRLTMRKSQAKGYLVDWPSFVIYSEMDWAKFVSQQPHEPVLFRIMAQTADVYRGEFTSEEKYMCLQISNPLDVHAAPLYAYALRSSSTGRSLDFVMLRASGKAVTLMLKLKYPESGTAPDQVLVNDFLGEGWVALKW